MRTQMSSNIVTLFFYLYVQVGSKRFFFMTLSYFHMHQRKISDALKWVFFSFFWFFCSTVFRKECPMVILKGLFLEKNNFETQIK